MAESVEIVVLDDFLPEIAAALDPAMKALLTKAAQATVAIAQDLAAKDTGFMVSTIYYKTADESTYGQGAMAPPGDSYMLPEVDAPSGDEVIVIAVAADYAEFQEYGTIYQPGQPFMTPAAAALTAALNAGEGMDLEAALASLIGL